MGHLFNLFPPHPAGSTQDQYKESWSARPGLFFSKSIKAHRDLHLDYRIHCSVLNETLSKDKVSPEIVRSQVQKVLDKATFLEHLYYEFLIVDREVLALRRQCALYQSWLSAKDELTLHQAREDYKKLLGEINHNKALSRKLTAEDISRDTVETNWYRLYTLRLRRFLGTLENLAKQSNWIHSMEEWTASFVRYFAWIFFAPRLFANLFVLVRHSIQPRRRENELEPSVRVFAQFKRRWFEIFNDFPWFTGGLVGCFILVGTLAPVALYVGIALQVYDVILAAIRLEVEIGRLEKIAGNYKEELDGAKTEEERAYWQSCLKHLEQRIDHDLTRFQILMGNNLALVVGMMLALPILGLHPAVPIIGAAIAVVTTIVVFTLLKLHDAHQPQDKVSESLLWEVILPPPPSEDQASEVVEEGAPTECVKLQP